MSVSTAVLNVEIVFGKEFKRNNIITHNMLTPLSMSAKSLVYSVSPSPYDEERCVYAEGILRFCGLMSNTAVAR
jgi:hypothetical protein